MITVRWLIGFHLIRFVGVYSLSLNGRHELPYEFAAWAGPGDMIVATLALLLRLIGKSRTALTGWNILGLVDIVTVTATAGRSEMDVPGSMQQLDRFPLFLRPTMVVPVIFVAHGLMLARVFLAKP